MNTETLTTEEKILRLAEGNPEAFIILSLIQNLPEFIDYLYEFAPRGPEIVTLWKEWCHADLRTFIVVLGHMINRKQPEVMDDLMAEALSTHFAEAWESARD